MSLFLTIDQGNSAAKLALWEGSELLKVSIEEHLSIDDVARFIAPATRVELVLYCSVAGRGQELVAGMAAMSRKVVRLRSDMRLPLMIDYGTPGTLGVDRIAAAVGAMALYPSTPLLVVDAGTAVTYDAVSADGHFVGGNIAPGINMRLEALHRFTAPPPPGVKAPRELNPDEFTGPRYSLGNGQRCRVGRGGSHYLLSAEASRRHPRGDDRRLGARAQQTM